MENELVKSSNQFKTKLEKALCPNENGMVSAKHLYELLGLEPTNYSRWCKSNFFTDFGMIDGVILNEEHMDTGIEFENSMVDSFRHEGRKPIDEGGRPSQDYLISIRIANRICLKSKSEHREEIMEYFLDLEESIGKSANALAEIENKYNALLEKVSAMQIEQKKSEERFKYLNTKMQEQEKRQEEVYSLSVKNSTTLQTIDMSAYASITEEAEWANEIMPRVRNLADIYTSGDRDKCMDRIIELAEERGYLRDSYKDLLTHYCTTHQGQKTFKKIFVMAQFEESREGFENALIDLEKEWGIYIQNEGQKYFEQLTKDMMAPPEDIVPEFHNRSSEFSNKEFEEMYSLMDKL